MQIASIHNLAFYLRLVRQARQRIVDGTFGDWYKEMAVKTMRRL
jgi:tRNA-guanine transglycosylase